MVGIHWGEPTPALRATPPMEGIWRSLCELPIPSPGGVALSAGVGQPGHPFIVEIERQIDGPPLYYNAARFYYNILSNTCLWLIST
jgi:hypothetical protein